MSGAVRLHPQYIFMARTGNNFTGMGMVQTQRLGYGTYCTENTARSQHEEENFLYCQTLRLNPKTTQPPSRRYQGLCSPTKAVGT